MSAKYKCDFCNKKAMYHIGKYDLDGYSHNTEISKKLYGKGSCNFNATLKITHQWCEYKQDGDENIDICEKCLNEIKVEAMKKINKI